MSPVNPWRTLLDRLVHHWPRKLAALAVALVLWLVLTGTDGSTAHNTLLVPITVEGLADDLVAVGLPTHATVTVSGPTARVDRLRPENFEAALDLTGLSGEFSASVEVTLPQDTTLEGVTPGEVFGLLEALTTTQVPVAVTVMGAGNVDQRWVTAADPDVATVYGRAAMVAQASAVVAVVPSGSGVGVISVSPHAVDAAGRPLPELTVEPANVAVTLQAQAVRVERRVPVSLLPIFADGWSDPQNAGGSVLLLGPQSVLQDLEQVVGIATLPTDAVPDGRYTRPLALTLPDGVLALETPTVSLAYQAPPPTPSPPTPPLEPE